MQFLKFKDLFVLLITCSNKINDANTFYTF